MNAVDCFYEWKNKKLYNSNSSEIKDIACFFLNKRVVKSRPLDILEFPVGKSVLSPKKI